MMDINELGRIPDGTGLSPTAEPVPVSSADAASIPCAGTRWETFLDAAYFDMWCVRKVGERRFGHGFYLVNCHEARELVDLLDTYAIAIEARSDATGTGAAEGKSAAIAKPYQQTLSGMCHDQG